MNAYGETASIGNGLYFMVATRIRTQTFEETKKKLSYLIKNLPAKIHKL